MPPDWLEYFRNDGLENFPLFIYNYYSFREPIIGHIRKHVPPGGTIVEPGCGTGLTAILLSSMGYHVLAFDKDENIVQIAKENNERLGGRAEIKQMDIFKSSGKLNQVFDLAYSYGFVEHFEDSLAKDAMKILGILARMVLVVVPTHDDPLVSGQRTFNFDELEHLCRSSHLTPIEKFGVGTGLIRWPKVLLPPIVFKRFMGRVIKCENIGMVCKSLQYV